MKEWKPCYVSVCTLIKFRAACYLFALLVCVCWPAWPCARVTVRHAPICICPGRRMPTALECRSRWLECWLCVHARACVLLTWGWLKPGHGDAAAICQSDAPALPPSDVRVTPTPTFHKQPKAFLSCSTFISTNFVFYYPATLTWTFVFQKLGRWLDATSNHLSMVLATQRLLLMQWGRY